MPMTKATAWAAGTTSARRCSTGRMSPRCQRARPRDTVCSGACVGSGAGVGSVMCRCVALLPASGHRRTHLGSCRGSRIETRRNAPLVHDHQAIGQRKQFVQVLRDQQHPHPRSPLGNNLFLDGGDAHHVEPARRLGSQQHLGLAGQLTSEQQPLEVAAGQHAD